MSDAKTSSVNNVSDLHRLPSVGELERALSQDIQASYRQLSGSQPKKVLCHLFGHCIGIVIEQSITSVERLLANQNDAALVSQVRQKIDDAFRQEIAALVEKRFGVKASSVLLETSLEAGMTGSLVVLVSLPKVRNLASIPKTETYRKMSRKGSNGNEPSIN